METVQASVSDYAKSKTSHNVVNIKHFKNAVVDIFMSERKKKENFQEYKKVFQGVTEDSILKVIYDVAHEMAICYSYQILAIGEHFEDLAKYAVSCMFQTLRNEDGMLDRNSMLLSVLDRNRNPEFSDRHILRESGERWYLSEIFREPGICMPEMKEDIVLKHEYIAVMLYQTSNDEADYGFRFPLTLWEEEEEKFTICNSDQEHMKSCDQIEGKKDVVDSYQGYLTLVLYDWRLFGKYILEADPKEKRMAFKDYVEGKIKRQYQSIALRPVTPVDAPLEESITNCDFSNTDLSYLRITKLTREIKYCRFTDGNLSYVDMSGIFVMGSKFDYVDFFFTCLKDANLTNSENEFKQANFLHANLKNAKLPQSFKEQVKTLEKSHFEEAVIFSHPEEDMATKPKTSGFEVDETDTQVKLGDAGAVGFAEEEEGFKDIQHSKGACLGPDYEQNNADEDEEEEEEDDDDDIDEVDSFSNSFDISSVFSASESDRGKTPLSELNEDSSMEILDQVDELNATMEESGDENFVFAWAARGADNYSNVFLVAYVHSTEEKKCSLLMKKLDEMECTKYRIWLFNKPIGSNFPVVSNSIYCRGRVSWVDKMWKILHLNAMRLLQEHSNISYMTADRYVCDRNGAFREGDCIVVYVRNKGYFPAKERLIPRRLPNDVIVDVREGYYIPLMDHPGDDDNEASRGKSSVWGAGPPRRGNGGNGEEEGAIGEDEGGSVEGNVATRGNEKGPGEGPPEGGYGAPGTVKRVTKEGKGGLERDKRSTREGSGGNERGTQEGNAAPERNYGGTREGNGSQDGREGAVGGWSGFKQLKIGCDISRHDYHLYGTGTLGIFAKCIQTKEIGLVTAAHTLFAKSGGEHADTCGPQDIEPLALPTEGGSSMYPSDNSFVAQASDDDAGADTGAEEDSDADANVDLQLPPLNLRGPQPQRWQGVWPLETYVVHPSEGVVSKSWFPGSPRANCDERNRKCAILKEKYFHWKTVSLSCDFLLKRFHEEDHHGPVEIGIDAAFASLLEGYRPKDASIFDEKTKQNLDLQNPQILKLEVIMKMLNEECELDKNFVKEQDGSYSLVVFKYGNTTNLTRGKLKFFGSIPSTLPYVGSSSYCLLPNQMEVQKFDGQSPEFADHGDSGAIVFTFLRSSLFIVGQVIGKVAGSGVIVVTPIEPILETLRIEFLRDCDYPAN